MRARVQTVAWTRSEKREKKQPAFKAIAPESSLPLLFERPR